MTLHPDFASLQQVFHQIRDEVSRRLIGCDDVVEQLMISLLAGEHCLIEAPPGTAKSLAVASLSRVVGLSLNRIRCTPDLTPQELVGLGANPKDTLDIRGPLFANVLLVADLERLTPRANSLIQQAIQERQVVLDGRRHALLEPFMLVATQYPRHDGIEADVARSSVDEYHDDRFMFKIKMGYPDEAAEFKIAEAPASASRDSLEQVIGPDEIRRFQSFVCKVEASPAIIDYILRLVRATRIHEGETPDFVYEWVDFGAGPRATHHLTLAAKTHAALRGRNEITVDDVQAVIHPILRHRIIINRNARSTGVTVERVITRLLYEVSEAPS